MVIFNHVPASCAVSDIGGSVLIGLTLAVDPDFKVLFIVIIFHRMSSTNAFSLVSYSTDRNIRGSGDRISTCLSRTTVELLLGPLRWSDTVRDNDPYRDCHGARYQIDI
jgi:hypothetical protein